MRQMDQTSSPAVLVLAAVVAAAVYALRPQPVAGRPCDDRARAARSDDRRGGGRPHPRRLPRLGAVPRPGRPSASRGRRPCLSRHHRRRGDPPGRSAVPRLAVAAGTGVGAEGVRGGGRPRRGAAHQRRDPRSAWPSPISTGRTGWPSPGRSRRGRSRRPRPTSTPPRPAVEQAKAMLELRRSELASAEARLIEPSEPRSARATPAA